MTEDLPTGAAENAAQRPNPRLARSAARLAAVQALYQMEMTGIGGAAVIREFETCRIGAEIDGAQYRDADIDHFRAVVDGVSPRQRDVDRLTDEALIARWPLGKIDPTLRAIFRAAAVEFLTLENVPPRVAITEYVDVAKAFFSDPKISGFTNAVLDHMARRAQPGAFDAAAADDAANGPTPSTRSSAPTEPNG